MAVGFMAAVAKYFGKKEGQTLGEFKKEVDELTDKDRTDLAPLLSKVVGEEVNPARGPVVPSTPGTLAS